MKEHIDMQSDRTLTAGKWSVTEAEAANVLATYLGYRVGDAIARRPVYAWPHYDGFESNSGPDELADGDLLAPVLLNVGVTIEGFVGLKEVRPELEARLRDVPADVTLQAAAESDIATVARLFALLDTHPVPTVRGTTLSKVLHRKRPDLIPLHDRYVNVAYVSDADVPRTLPTAKHRTWEDYITLLMRAMRDDLTANDGAWADVADGQHTGSTRLTPLRALDIVVWTLGKTNPPSDTDVNE